MKTFQIKRFISQQILKKHDQFYQYFLDRPEALNSLNYDMLTQLNNFAQLLLKKSSPSIFTLKGKGRAFSAGGDLKYHYAMYQKYISDKTVNVRAMDNLIDHFFYEYELEQTLFNLINSGIFQISIWNGIVMGGGVGISMFCPYRIATERTKFSMPENYVGFFPDCGASYFLPKLRKNIGAYLGLTGKILRGQEVRQVELSDYFVKEENLEKVENELEQEIKNYNIYSKKDPDVIVEIDKKIRDIIEKYDEKVDLVYEGEDEINELFDVQDDFEIFYKKIEQAQQKGSQIAQYTLDCFKNMRPLSVRVVYELMDPQLNLNFLESINIDFILALNFLKDEEFYEGIRCKLIDKTQNPKYKYKHVLEVPYDEVAKYFDKQQGISNFN